MKTIIIATTLFTATIVLIGTISLIDIKNVKGITAQLFSSQTSELYKECIRTFSEEKLSFFKVVKTKINNDGLDDAFIMYTKGPQCGTAGCVIELCVSDSPNKYVHVPFGFAANTITTKETVNNSMHDLILNDDKQTTMTWDGTTYVLNTN